MTNHKFRVSQSAVNKPTEISVKGLPLTNLEIDGNNKAILDELETIKTNTFVSDDLLKETVVFPVWTNANTGNVPYNTSSAKLQYIPLTNTLIATRFQGIADRVVTNANLTGGVTSVGNVATVVTNANLTGGVISVGNATTVVTNANLTGAVTSIGNATTVVTNANLTGEVTSIGNETTVPTATVINKPLTGFVSAPGTITNTDTILNAIQKLNGNDDTNANMTGEVTSIGNVTTVPNSTVISKFITGFVSAPGTVGATDTILQAVNKIDGNVALRAPILNAALNNPTIVVTPPVDDNTLKVASTAFVLQQASSTLPSVLFATSSVGTSTRYARSDHAHPSPITPLFRAFRATTNQTATSGVLQKIQLNAETFDITACYDPSTNFRFLPLVAGYYNVSGQMGMGSSGSIGAAQLHIYKNGVSFARKMLDGVNYTGTSSTSMSVNDLIFMNGTTDILELWGAITGTAPTIQFGESVTVFSAVLVSR